MFILELMGGFVQERECVCLGELTPILGEGLPVADCLCSAISPLLCFRYTPRLSILFSRSSMSLVLAVALFNPSPCFSFLFNFPPAPLCFPIHTFIYVTVSRTL